MARKPPSTDDLKGLLPIVAWRQTLATPSSGLSSDSTTIDGGGGGGEDENEVDVMMSYVAGYYTIKGCMEDLQYKILVGVFLGDEVGWLGPCHVTCHVMTLHLPLVVSHLSCHLSGRMEGRREPPCLLPQVPHPEEQGVHKGHAAIRAL